MPKPPPSSDSATARILFSLAIGVFIMALIGAITRLTESGLSIMEWAPISGILPPLSAADWQAAYDLYAQSGEFRAQPAPPSLGEFQAIFWWEWIHRQWGRLLGLALLASAFWFWHSGRLTARRATQLARTPDKPLLWLLVGLFLLGLFQALVGWWMVKSGFSDRTDVAPVRLAFHLTLALVLYALLINSALHRASWHRAVAQTFATRNLRNKTRLLLLWRVHLVLLFLLIVSGALTAGSNAGFIYNTWPLMDGEWVPLDYTAPAAPSWIGNALENPSAIQFHHRWIAAALVVLTLALSAWTLITTRSTTGINARSTAHINARLTAHTTAQAQAHRPRLPFTITLYILAPAVVVFVQFLTGITTLLLVVPIWLGVLHQAFAILLLTATLFVLALISSGKNASAENRAGDGNRTHDT